MKRISPHAWLGQRQPGCTPSLLLIWFLASGLCLTAAAAGPGEYDREFYVGDSRDLPDTNLLDGEPDGDPNAAGAQVTLRAALMQAHYLGGKTLIRVGSMTITNTMDQQYVNGNVTIAGQGPGSTILDGNRISRVMSVGDLFDRTEYTVKLVGCTLRNGLRLADASGMPGGAGLLNWWSTVTLENVVLESNNAGGDLRYAHGGAIASFHSLILQDCVLRGNQASALGGGIYNRGSVSLTRCTLERNTAANGGGLYNLVGPIRLFDTTFRGNTAWDSGGAAFNEAGDGSLELQNSTLSGNRAGSRGGAFYNRFGHINLLHATVAFNSAPSGGGGIYQEQPHPYPGVDFRNTILAFNSPTNGGGNTGRIIDGGGNVVTDSSIATPSSHSGDPLLGPLKDNGGGLGTHALHLGSPAIDMADAIPGLTKDQRGYVRPRDGDSNGSVVADAGAFEVQDAPLPVYAGLAVSPVSHGFGEVTVGTDSLPLILELQSEGPTDLGIVEMVLSDPARFSLDVQAGDQPSGTLTPTISHYGRVTVGVRFRPDSSNEFTATLSIRSNDTDEPVKQVQLTGHGVTAAPNIEVQPAALEYDPLWIGSTAALAVTVRNGGTAPLAIGEIHWASPPAMAFALTDDGVSGAALSPGGSQSLTVLFTPASAATYENTLVIPSNDSDQPSISLPIRGTGVEPVLATTTLSLTGDGGFGDDALAGVALDSQGAIIGAGYLAASNSPSSWGTTALLIKKGSSWTNYMELGPVQGSKQDSTDQFLDVAVDSTDHVLVTGIKSGDWDIDGYHQTMVLRKYSPDGALLWEQTFKWHAWNAGRGVFVDSADNVYVAGNVFAGFTENGMWTVWKYNRDGELQSPFPLTENFSNVQAPQDIAYAVAADSTGAFVVVGQRVMGANHSDWHVRKYSADLGLIWQESLTGSAGAIDAARDVALDSHGDVIVTGYVNNGSATTPNYDWAIVKYRSAKGERVWTRTFESASGRSEQAFSVAIDPRDDVLVGGTCCDDQGRLQWRIERLNGVDGTLAEAQQSQTRLGQQLRGLSLREGRLACAGARANGADQDWLITKGAYLAQPFIEVNPEQCVFGYTRLGQYRDLTVTLRNIGTLDAVLASIGSQNPIQAPFQVLSDGFSGKTIAPGDSAALTLRFTPAAEGVFNDSLDVGATLPRPTSITLTLQGKGAPPATLAGEVLQVLRPGPLGDDYARGIALNSRGEVAAAGYFAGGTSPNYQNTALVSAYGSNPWSDTLEVGPVVPGVKDDSSDLFLGVAADSQDHLLVVGRKSGSWGGGDYYHSVMAIRKYSPQGELVWSDGGERTFFNGPWGQANSVAVDASDNVIVGGSSFGNWSTEEWKWTILKYTPDGKLADGFPVHFNDSRRIGYPDMCFGIAVDEQGGICAVGCVGLWDGNRDWRVRKLQPNGSLAWEDTLSGPAELVDDAQAVVIDAQGNPIVAGYSNHGTDNGAGANYDGVVIKYRGADGQRLWTRVLAGTPDRNDACYAVAVDGLGNPLVAGYFTDSRGIAIGYLARLSGADGSVLGEQTWADEKDVIVYAVNYRGRALALAGTWNPGSTREFWVCKALPPPPRITEFQAVDSEQWRLRWVGQWEPGAVLSATSLLSPDWQTLASGLTAPEWIGPLPGTAARFHRVREP